MKPGLRGEYIDSIPEKCTVCGANAFKSSTAADLYCGECGSVYRFGPTSEDRLRNERDLLRAEVETWKQKARVEGERHLRAANKLDEVTRQRDEALRQKGEYKGHASVQQDVAYDLNNQLHLMRNRLDEMTRERDEAVAALETLQRDKGAMMGVRTTTNKMFEWVTRQRDEARMVARQILLRYAPRYAVDDYPQEWLKENDGTEIR